MGSKYLFFLGMFIIFILSLSWRKLVLKAAFGEIFFMTTVPAELRGLFIGAADVKRMFMTNLLGRKKPDAKIYFADLIGNRSDCDKGMVLA